MAEIDDKRGAGGEDAAVEATVLRQLLLLHPAQVTVEELIVDVAADPEAFAERDAIERAVRDLAAPASSTATASSRSPRARPCASTSCSAAEVARPQFLPRTRAARRRP